MGRLFAAVSSQMVAPVSQSLSTRPVPDMESASEAPAVKIEPPSAKKFVVPSTPSQAQKYETL